jgi:LacI family transcriptional regulator
MLQRKVDGVAVMTSEMEERLLRTLGKRQIPTIFMDTATGPRGAAVVSVDYSEGVTQAMKHLFALGHRKIAFISGPLSLASAKTRAKAFLRELQSRGLAGKPHWNQESDHRVEGGHRAMQRILRDGERPTAVLCSNDLTAIGAMGAIHESGLEIPRDISIVGFDDIQLSAYTQPALTTVHVPRRELAATAFRSLFQDQTNGKKNQKRAYVIEPRLVVRQSTGPAPSSSRKRKNG